MESEKSAGDLIRAALDARGWTQRDLAKILGRTLPTVNEILQGKRAITPEMAIALSSAFRLDAVELLRIDALHRLKLYPAFDEEVVSRARLYEVAPVKDLERRGWIKKTDTAEELREELHRFYGVDSLKQDPEISASFLKTATDDPMNIAQRAWCFRAKMLAGRLPVGPYSRLTFETGLSKLRKLAGWPEETRKVPRILAEMGIRFVVIEAIPNTRIDGAAFRLKDGSPVIALSLRYDRIDAFWHALGHELSHIGHEDEPVVDMDIVGDSRKTPIEQNAIERRADAEAAALTIDPDELASFIVRVGPLYSRARINQFANRLVVHPGIIVGQLQHRGEIGYQALRDTLVKVRDAVTSEALTDGYGHVIGL